MTIKVLELHHHAIPVPADKAADVQQFYSSVLGLDRDQGRPEIPNIPGAWMYVGEESAPTAQIHIMGVNGLPAVAKNEIENPTRPHVALAVEDIQEAKAELERMNVRHWVIGGLVGTDSIQIFLDDPAGNMIELHQIGTCRCNRQMLPA
jgi:catechol 2,3-dioxygenase-like lactoylglutathione lyase family enzyme